MKYRRLGISVALAGWMGACAQAAAYAPNANGELPKLEQPTEVPSSTSTTAAAELAAKPLQAVQPTPPQFIFPPAEVNPVSAWRPPPYQAPLALRESDHFYLSHPIPSGEAKGVNSQYRYGSTAFGEESIHTGVDIGAQRGTPVLAAAEGEVVWVGYGLYRGIFDAADPYGLAIAIRHDFGYQNQTLYTVYAHLEGAYVWDGQRVERGEVIGLVGSSGHTTGPHLHFEVRVGENRYFATRNPELWMVPAEGWGVLAGRIFDSFGRTLNEFYLEIESMESGEIWKAWTYQVGTVIEDEIYQENIAVGDLPAGPYVVRAFFVGRIFETWLYLYPGQTNVIEFHGRQGFLVEPTAAPVEFP